MSSSGVLIIKKVLILGLGSNKDLIITQQQLNNQLIFQDQIEFFFKPVIFREQ